MQQKRLSLNRFNNWIGVCWSTVNWFTILASSDIKKAQLLVNHHILLKQ